METDRSSTCLTACKNLMAPSLQGAASGDQMYFVVRGHDLEAFADALQVVNGANAALKEYAIAGRQTLSTTQVVEPDFAVAEINLTASRDPRRSARWP